MAVQDRRKPLRRGAKAYSITPELRQELCAAYKSGQTVDKLLLQVPFMSRSGLYNFLQRNAYHPDLLIREFVDEGGDADQRTRSIQGADNARAVGITAGGATVTTADPVVMDDLDQRIELAILNAVWDRLQQGNVRTTELGIMQSILKDYRYIKRMDAVSGGGKGNPVSVANLSEMKRAVGLEEDEQDKEPE